jgi:glycosyltransferase involved in cell wall biosynthesis
MVGTLEPRKGHAQALAAFEALWAEGLAVNLVIVGKQGWAVDDLAERIRQHSQVGQQLFWLEGISDEYLDEIYTHCNVLLAASFGEGFGLPIVEAFQRGLPVLARDLPVFREVGGDQATYFDAKEPAELAAAVANWLRLHADGCMHPPGKIELLTWQESAAQLFAGLTGASVRHRWLPDRPQ